MAADIKIRRALISVYDKTGVVDFARALHDEFGIEIISTGGTAKILSDAGIPVTLVEDLTGFPEMLDGRVKTLHPKIHAAILADRDNLEHMRQLAEQGIEPIDMVVVNLYPFEKTVSDPDCTFEQAIEMIDIGGPCLLRAAAKNHRHVLVVCDQRQSNAYEFTLDQLRSPYWEDLAEAWRQHGADEAFWVTAYYDSRVTKWLGEKCRPDGVPSGLLAYDGIAQLRYGENPHQTASTNLIWQWTHCAVLDLDAHSDHIRGGTGAMSFNNYVDASAAFELCSELTRAKSKVWHRLIAGAKTPLSKSATALLPIDDETSTRRNLPHIQRPGATYFVTFRGKKGEFTPAERDLIMECCIYPHGKLMSLHAVVVMPDHVHLLFTPLETASGKFASLSKILHGIKGVSGRKVADARGRSGPVWMDESWDRIIRDETEFHLRTDYIHENPDRAGLDFEGAYPWCVFEPQARWDPERRSAGVGVQHELRAGQMIRGVGVEPRSWHRLLAGATPARATPPAGSTPHVFTCVFVKHTNACGVGVGAEPEEAYRQAYLGDPNAAMGGILAVNFNVDAGFAQMVMETYQRFGKPLKESGHPAAPGAFFIEVWVAPSFDEEAVPIIRGTAEPTAERPDPPKKNWGKRMRLLDVGDMAVEPDPDEMDIKKIAGGVLMQTRDLVGLNEDQWKAVSERDPSEREMADLRLAWLVCKHTKSNAISICRDGMLIGNGAGQMSRVMSCRIATWLARENGNADKLPGSAAASDAFFPFRDGPGVLIDAGVTAIIQPGGSKRDAETIAACNERDVAMIFTGTRHFKH